MIKRQGKDAMLSYKQLEYITRGDLITTRDFSPEVLGRIVKTLEIWTEKIKRCENFSFIKFGDGELRCMMGCEGGDQEYLYYKELAQKLHAAWYFFNTKENIYIAKWNDHKPGMDGTTDTERFLNDLISGTNVGVDFVNFEILLQNTLTKQKFDFYKTIKASKRKKIYVGPGRILPGIKGFLNTDLAIEAPYPDTFRYYDKVLEWTLKEACDNSIIMLSVGPVANLLIHDLVRYNPNITCLDMGSALEPLTFVNTREGQLPRVVVRKYYRKILYKYGWMGCISVYIEEILSTKAGLFLQHCCCRAFNLRSWKNLMCKLLKRLKWSK